MDEEAILTTDEEGLTLAANEESILYGDADNMVYCPDCCSNIEEGDLYCDRVGWDMICRCPHCGRELL